MANKIEDKATAVIYHDTRRLKKKENKFPVKLKVTYRRERMYFTTGKSLSIQEFARVMGERPRNDAKELRMYLEALEMKALTIIANLTPFSFQSFEQLFLSAPKEVGSVLTEFQDYISGLETEGRVSTAHSYSNACKAIMAFADGEKLFFRDISAKWLYEFESWLTEGRPDSKTGKPTKSKASISTAGIYLRSLRTIYNIAISKKIVSQESYPFGRNRYQIPQSRNVKKAVSKADIQKLFEYNTAPGSESYHRDLWLFSYLCNGANMKDIAKLRYENLENDTIVFVRSKTARSSKQDLKPIAAHLTDRAKVIIQRWGQKPASPKKFIFPVLEDGLSPKEERARVQQLIKQVNKYIRRIAGACGINQPISTYTARHSFATVLKQSSAPISYISEALGHKDLKTTEHYLGSFDEDTRKQFAAVLTDF